jgi:hypothetical protein
MEGCCEGSQGPPTTVELKIIMVTEFKCISLANCGLRKELLDYLTLSNIINSFFSTFQKTGFCGMCPLHSHTFK